jgi:hypothetical protein
MKCSLTPGERSGAKARLAVYAVSMCMQCMMGAMSAGAGASGLRAWLFARAPAWLTPARRRVATRVLLVAGVLAASVVGPTPG